MIGASFDAVLASASGGYEHAFAIFWRDMQPALLRYLRVIAPAACEDLAWETWLEVARGLSRRPRAGGHRHQGRPGADRRAAARPGRGGDPAGGRRPRRGPGR